MKGFDFSSPAVLHLGRGSGRSLMALGVALATTLAAVLPVRAGQPPRVTVARAQGAAELGAQLDQGLASLTDSARQERLHREADRIDKVRASFRSNVEAVARSHGIGTCFGGFLDGQAERTPVEQSTILILARTNDGRTLEVASGFVVRDSAVEGHNRIATARHVLNLADTENYRENLDYVVESARKAYPLTDDRSAVVQFLRDNLRHEGDRKDAFVLAADILAGPESLSAARTARLKDALGIQQADYLDAFASDGDYLGRLQTVAMGQPDGKVTVIAGDGPDGIGRTAADWGVAQIDAGLVSPATLRRFDAIPGLALAPVQSPEKTWGVSGDKSHPAATPGYSGGPVFDAAGRVHGVVSGVDYRDDVIRADVAGVLSVGRSTQNPMTRSAQDGLPGVELPMRQPLIVNPLGAPELLRALGNAGKGVRTASSAPLRSGHLRLTLAGMPGGYCAAAPTVQGSLDARMPDVRPVPRGRPGPWETRTARDGSVLAYDGDGLLQSLSLPDGTLRSYRGGVLASLTRPDGSVLDYASRTVSGPVGDGKWVAPVEDDAGTWVAPVGPAR